MAAFFTIGERKTRPGVYFRYENWGLPAVVGADDGKGAAPFRSNWGPLGKPIAIESYEDIARYYGDGGENGTTANAIEQFKGGARVVYALRLGSGGTHGSYEVLDATGKAVIKLTLAYPGSRKFQLTIRPTLDDPDNISELLLLDGTSVLEKFTFAAAEDGSQAAALIEAVKNSAYFKLNKVTDSNEPLAAVYQEDITPGTDPDIDIAAYSAAFEALEAYRWNVLSIDTTDTAVQILMQMYLNRIFRGGKFTIGVIGENSTGSDKVSFETRLSHASAYNDYQMVYVGNGFIDLAGKVYDGWLAAARIAGLIAGTPSNDTITHLAVTGAVDLIEPLTNNQYELAIKAGMLTFSTSSANVVWVEQGINTLVLPGTNDDAGWQKIKRVKVRFELMQRLNDTVDGLVGRINNDSDGRMTIIQSSNAVCNAMVAERKLLAGARCEIDPDNAPAGDSAWFIVVADDIDALEKMYLTFKYRFAPEEA